MGLVTEPFWPDGESLLPPLKKEIATQHSIFAWEIPWTQEPGGLKSMGLQRAGHDLVTKQQQSDDWIKVNALVLPPLPLSSPPPPPALTHQPLWPSRT